MTARASLLRHAHCCGGRQAALCALPPGCTPLTSPRVLRARRVLDGATGRVLRALRGHSSPVLGLALSGDARLLASCSGHTLAGTLSALGDNTVRCGSSHLD